MRERQQAREVDVGQGYNGLGFQLLVDLTGQATTGNILISPLSIALALTLAANGATGETRRELEDALGVAGVSRAGVNEATRALHRALEDADPHVTLAIANSLWVRAGLSLDAAYQRRMQELFGARVTTLDFADPRSVETINRWVAEQTREKITGIIEQIAWTDALFLLNAVYFKGRWQRPFDPAQTAEGDFRLPNGARKRVPMLEQFGAYPYHQTEQIQMVSLPYGGGRLRMDIVLPAPAAGLAELLPGMTAASWAGLVGAMREWDGRVVLPRFRLTYDVKLNDALKRAGIVHAFADAEFPDLFAPPVPRDLAIDEVRHKTFMEVNEEGTEAAAVTSISFGVTSARPSFDLVVDRPFVLALRDHETEAMLFLGAIVDPTQPAEDDAPSL